MKKALYFVIILLPSQNTKLFGRQKWSLGFSIQTYNSKLFNVGQKEYTAYDDFSQPSFQYLAPHFEQSAVLSYGAHFIFERRIKNNKSLDFGLGLSKTKNNLYFDYTADRSAKSTIYNTINMQRNYVYLPVNFNYFACLGSNISLKTALGVTTNFLYSVRDNYVSQIEVGHTKFDQYNIVNFLGRAKIGFVYEATDNQSVEINLFTNYGLNSITSKNGFTFLLYNNLSQARECQYGIEVNYFFL